MFCGRRIMLAIRDTHWFIFGGVVFRSPAGIGYDSTPKTFRLFTRISFLVRGIGVEEYFSLMQLIARAARS